MADKKRRLTRDVVVETAAKMANENGNVEALTLTAVAEALGVRPPSLYNHVSGMQDLRRAMALHAVKHLVAAVQRATVGLTGREALMATALAYRAFARNHPGIYPLTIRAPDAEDDALVPLAQMFLQSLLLMLGSMGLEGERALHAVRGLRAVLHGFVSVEAAEGFRMPLNREESFQLAVETFLNGLSRSDAQASA